MRSSSKYILGAILVIFGVLMIFGNIGFLDMSWLVNITWPMLLIMVAFFFFLGYLSKGPKEAGLLVPAGIIMTVGVVCLIGEAFNNYDLVWPGFILAPAVGLGLLYLFGSRESGLLVPVGVLMTVSAVCFISMIFDIWQITWPGFIMAPAVGLFMLYLGERRSNGLLIPVFILTAISVTLFSVFCLPFFAGAIKYMLGGLLILAGLGTIIKKPVRKNSYGGSYDSEGQDYDQDDFGRS